MSYQINPIRDARWRDFIEWHPEASIFHTPEWMSALWQSYRYIPTVYTTSGPSEPLQNGIAGCVINSRFTGRRLVSLPFSDHCQPLATQPHELEQLALGMQRDYHDAAWKHIELRPMPTKCLGAELGFVASKASVLHVLHLDQDLDKLFARLHKSCIQRPIRRAEREGLTYESGVSEALLKKFYWLLIKTRRRHQVPPQPLGWFRNLIATCRDLMSIRVASKDGEPVASIITLSYKGVVTYKYGCSNPARYQLGGMTALLWQAIQQAHGQGAKSFDMGRSDLDQDGLVLFKDRWGAARSPLTYYRYPEARAQWVGEGWKMGLGQHIFARMPTALLTASGRLLYRHIG